MKKGFKVGCLAIVGGFLLLVLLGIVAMSLGYGGEETADPETTPGASQETPAVEPEEAPAEEPAKEDNTVTLENYNKIAVGDTLTGEGGMTLEEVTAIFGKAPESKSESQSGDMKMIIASWTADGWDNLGDNVTVTFTNGKSSSKAQFGLDE